MDQYARVAVKAAVFSSDRPFDYRIPDELRGAVAPGARVVVPFGAGNRKTEGFVLALCSQASVENVKAIHKLLNQPDPSKNISIEQALRMHTYNGAYITFDERERGSLEAGKIADMVILDKNPMKIKPAGLKDIRVTETVLSGKRYQPGQKPSSALIHGLFRRGGI